MLKQQFFSKSAVFWAMECYSILDRFILPAKPATFSIIMGVAGFTETLVHIYQVVRRLPQISRRKSLICHLIFNLF